MALNVEQITSRLAQMPDAALQKYAAMNKNDPYIVALAVSESNRRKQMRQAAQAQQGQAPQPKVVDAAVQSMAQPMPEDMGIARLPAGDMNFADGGIVAFADGGDVERYQFGGSTAMVDRILQKPPQARTPEENAMLAQAGYDVQTRTLGPDSGVSGVNTFLQNIGPRMRDYFTGGASRLSDEELSQKPAAGGAATERILRGMGMGQATAPLGPQASYSNEGRREPMAAATSTAPAAPAAKTDTAQRGPRATGTAGAPTAPGTPAASTEPTGIDALSAKLARDTELAQGALRNMRAGQAQQLVQTAEQDKAEGERMRAARGDVFAAREARLAEREKGVAKMKDQNLGLALLQAGAAMMSTPGNIGMALGKGVQVGSERYIAGIDKINAAKEKFAEARDRIDDLRLNRDDMNEREIRAENRAIRNAQLQGQQLFLDGATNDLKISNENQRAIFNVAAESLMTDRRIQGQKDVARISAQPAIERNALLRLAQSKDDKVRTEYGKLQAKVMEDLRKDNNYTMATPAQQQVMQTNALRQALMNNPFLSAYAANVGFSSTPTGGKVYDLTEP